MVTEKEREKWEAGKIIFTNLIKERDANRVRWAEFVRKFDEFLVSIPEDYDIQAHNTRGMKIMAEGQAIAKDQDLIAERLDKHYAEMQVIYMSLADEKVIH
jgi:hypothetical protein